MKRNYWVNHKFLLSFYPVSHKTKFGHVEWQIFYSASFQIVSPNFVYWNNILYKMIRWFSIFTPPKFSCIWSP